VFHKCIMSAFDWNDLRYFAALARTRRLAAAARLLRTSEASVLRHVRSLEARLGASLFIRRRDGHRLTAAGEALLPQVTEAEGLMSAIADSLSEQGGRSVQTVRIATTELGANWILLPELAVQGALAAGSPLDIDARPATSDLLEDERTVALRFHRPQRGDFMVKKLAVIAYGLFGARPSTSGKHKSAQFDAQAAHIGWNGEFADIGAARWLRALYGEHPPALRLATLAGHIQAAAAGIGAAGLPLFVGEKHAELSRLKGCPSEFSMEAWLVVPRQIRQQRNVRKAAEFIEAACKAQL
jgi:DNA-binding transcriptional LysR family regulator